MTDTRDADGPPPAGSTPADPGAERANTALARGANLLEGPSDPNRAPQSNPVAALALVAVFVWLGFVNPWMLVVILALVLMIFLHELGHYLTAKRAGMKVTEFFLFFGPRL